MLARLLLLFILVPMIELFLLLEMGQLAGTWPTIGLIIVTGFLGAYLARRQGLRVLARLRSEVGAGQLPAEAVFDGAIILVAAALLMAPGILTDTLGLLCLIPASRRVIKRLIWARIERSIRNNQFFTAAREIRFQEPEDIIIIDPDDYRQK